MSRTGWDNATIVAATACIEVSARYMRALSAIRVKATSRSHPNRARRDDIRMKALSCCVKGVVLSMSLPNNRVFTFPSTLRVLDEFEDMAASKEVVLVQAWELLLEHLTL